MDGNFLGCVGVGGGIFWVGAAEEGVCWIGGSGWTYFMGSWEWVGMGRCIFWVGGGGWR